MKNALLTFSFVFLALVYLAPFTVSAQNGRILNTPLCFSQVSGNQPFVIWATRDTNGATVCPDPQADYEQITHPAIPDTQVAGLCWNLLSSGNYQAAVGTAQSNGVLSCPTPAGDSSFVWKNTIPRSSFRNAPPAGGTTPPIIPSTPGGNTNNANNSNGNNGGGNTNGSTQTQGGCDTGFNTVGALCIPNSPFNNGDNIASETTVGGLAARIIKILLFFAGIVAVAMIIIGGYLYMTAAGNDTQAKNGRKTLTNAIIGLVIVILAYVIVQTVINFVSK